MRSQRTKVLRRPAPVDRMKRGVTMGFATTVILASVVAAASFQVGSSLEQNQERVQLLEAQRLDLMELQARTAAIAVETELRSAADERVELRRLMDRIEQRHVELLVNDPSFGSALIPTDTEPLLIGDAVAAAVEAVEFAVQFAASNSPDIVVDNALEVAIAATDALAGPLGERSQVASADAASTAARIRTLGLVLGGAFVFVGFVRLMVLGRPLVARLAADHEAHADAERQHRAEGLRRELTARLTEGLETAETEAGVLDVVERGLERVVADNPAELLLADSSKAHLRPMASNPAAATPGCGVQSPWSCPAVRRASTLHYPDSGAINACPHLADRGELAALCVPVSFMGDAMGVLHVTGEVGWNPEALRTEALEIIAGQAAVRLGSIRSFLKAEIQASTDVLTGLPNRRATEERIGGHLATRERASVAIADLDKFKQLNDTHGHEAGDRALRLFAEVLRESIREDDWAGRWGGEEFVIHLPGLAAAEAAAVLERIRANLAVACERSDGPDVTVSIGVVDTVAGDSLDALVALADDCLYHAKENGRDQVVVGPVVPAGELEPVS